MTKATIGKPLPDFMAIGTQGEVSAATLAGRRAVLYFYPKDNTPGCTNEAQNFRDRYSDFLALNCQIIGISRDSLKSHEGFINKQSLPFPLISDSDESLCALFDVIKMKNMYGKQVRGIQRSTFVLGAQRAIEREWRGVKVPGHAQEVLDFVKTR